jgi:LysM repeat protein/proteasome lid subunit RPN8/RPN11
MEETVKEKNVLADVKDTPDFKFPSYVKQMGNIDKRLKIYMEDYVHTYLYQYAHTDGGSEKLAVLLGKYDERDGEPVVIISGAVRALSNGEGEDKPAQFDDESWLYINEQACKYFSGLSVLGWVHIQPEMGIFMSRKDESFHKKCFKNNSQVLMLIDQTEKLDCFYIYDSEMLSLVPSKGYFIYYDKNENMQDYMIDNCISKPKDSDDAEYIDEDEESTYTSEGERKKLYDRVDAAGRIRAVLNKKEETKNRIKSGKYVTYVFLSAVMCAAFVIMGTNLVRNMDKISSLESQIVQMKVSYDKMSAKVESTASKMNETKAVFSQQDEDSENKAKKDGENQKPKGDENKTPIGEYTLQYGDTLWDLSRRFYGSEDRLSDILAANNISDTDTVYVGQKIIMP